MPPKRKKQVEDKDEDKVSKKVATETTTTVDSIPICKYDGSCYRNNPTHFQEQRHPKQYPNGWVPKNTDDKKDKKKKRDKKKDKKRKKKKKSSTTSSSSDDSSDSSDTSSSSSSSKPKKKKKSKDKKVKSDDMKIDPKQDAQTSSSQPIPVTPSAAVPNQNIAISNLVNPTNQPVLKKTSSLSNLLSGNIESTRPEVQKYRGLLQSHLIGTNKLTVDIKRQLQKYRNDNGITLAEHLQLLGQFGWTPDEYDIGEKEPEEVELDIEREVLKDPQGFQIIPVTSTPSNPQEEIVWSKVATKFFQTMKKAQGKFKIVKIGVIVNTRLRRQFEQKRKLYLQSSETRGTIQWGFHGTTAQSILAISKEGFKHPDDLAKKKGVSLLDDGFFGRGIYFSLYSDYAMWYSEERGSDQVLLCSLIPGLTFQCTERMDGSDRQAGYDSHYSPKGHEIILFESAQILPRYIITFSQATDN